MSYIVPPSKCIDAELRNFIKNSKKGPLDTPRVLLFPINLGPIFMKSIHYQAAQYHLEAIYIENEDFNVTAVCHENFLSQGILQDIETELLPNQCNEKSPVVEETPKIPTVVQSAEGDDEYMQEFVKWYNSSEVQYNYEITELERDLFTMPKKYSLVHCVGADLKMVRGIAVKFKEQFGQVDKLLQQNVMSGGIAVLKNKRRFIYYLVTKSKSKKKTTMKPLWSSLQNLRKHVEEHKVSKLAMPKIACGFDGMRWSRVKSMIQYIFKNTNVEIVVCSS